MQHADPASTLPELEDFRRRVAELEQENKTLRQQVSVGVPRLLEACLEGILVYQSGVIRYANPTLAAIFHQDSPAQLIGQPFPGSLVSPEYHPILAESTDRILAGERVPVSSIWQGRCRDGTTIPLRFRGTRTDWENNPAVLAVLVDVTQHLQIEAGLRASEERYRRLVELLPVALWISRDERLVYTNQAGLDLIGAPFSPLILGRNPFDFLHPDSHAAVKSQLERILSERTALALGEHRLICLDGRILEVLVSASCFHDQEGDAVQLILQDVTERKQAEAELRDREATLRALGDNLPEVALYQTRYTPAGQTSFSYISAGIQRLLGLHPAEVMEDQTSLYRLVHEEDVERLQATEQAALRERKPFDCELRHWTVSGGLRWFHWRSVPRLEADGSILRDGVVVDVTARRQAEEELRRHSERLQTIFDHIPVMISFFDLRGRFQMINRHWEKVLGWSLEEARTHPDLMAEFYPDPVVRREVMDFILHPPPGEWREFHLRLRDGRWLETAWANVLLSDGTSIGIGQDITQRKRDEEERQRLAERMGEMQRLESLGGLAGGIAHDFNNLLTSILGYANLAREQAPPGSTLGSYMEHVEQSAQRAGDLCRQMLAYAGKGRFVLEPLDLQAVVREAGPLLHVSVSRKVRLLIEWAEGRLPILADATQVRQALLNLVLNASEAIGEREGVITIRTRAVFLDSARLAELHLVEGLSPGPFVCLEAQDTGCGMEEATRARIFEPFFTSKFIGRGLGLSVVLGIMRGHKGTLEVISAPGTGSTFRLYFPLSAEPLLSSGFPPFESLFRGAGAALVADDEDSVRHLAELLLVEMGFEVQAVCDGQEALDRVRAAPDRFHLALIDVTMPRLDGVELARILQTVAPRLPVILMSGYSAQGISRAALGMMAGFLQKPFTRADLARLLQQVFSQPGNQG